MSTRHASLLPSSSRKRVVMNSSKPARKLVQRSDGTGLLKSASSPQSITQPRSERRSSLPPVSIQKEATATAGDLMRACSATLRPEDSIERAARVMRETQDGSIPVVDVAGRLIGIVSHRDITVKLVAMRASIPHAQVSDCMDRGAFALSADCTLQSCLSAMSWHQVKWLPIVDEDHRIIGTVSRSDLACYVCEHSQELEPGTITDVLWALAS